MEWYIECGGVYNINNKNVFGRKIFINPNNIDKELEKRFNNIDIYCTNYLYNEENQNESNIIGPLYFDLDEEIYDEESYNKVKTDTLLAISYITNILKVPKEYIRIFFSGSKGFHLIIPYNVFGITPCKDLNEKYKKIALEIKKYSLYKTIDIKIYDKKRLIRVPHSINGKTGLYKVPLTEEILRASTFLSMKLYASKDRKIDYKKTEYIENAKKAFNNIILKESNIKKNKKNNININPNYKIPICIKLIYNNGVEKGMRNNTTVILASSLLQKGINLEECKHLLNEWNLNKNAEPLSNNELNNTIESAYKNLLDNRKYGCTSIKNLGLCLENKCKLFKND